MTETKFTPGPWSFSTEPQPNGCPIIGARGLMIAMLAHSVRNPTQRHIAEANAHLIAAAPDLYAATDWVDSKLQTFWPADMDDLDEVDITLTYREIRALIDARRKARDE